MSHTEPLPFRIRIGVTGHRQLADPDSLAVKVAEVLDKTIFELIDAKDQAKLAGAATPIAFSVLTPLAEGADRLVAGEVLKGPGSKIEVVLPLTKEDYLEDFDTVESKDEFERLLKLARRPISLREKPLREDFGADELAGARRQAYNDVGKYVVRHCDVLVALWDGAPSRGQGGTAEIIEFARQENQPLIIIHTKAPFDIEVVQGDGLSTKGFDDLEAFNSFPFPAEARATYVENVYNDLFDNNEGRALPEAQKTVVRRQLLPFYARASLIAKNNQRSYQRAGLIAYSFAALAVTTVAFGTLFYKDQPIIFLIELLVLAASFLTVLAANRKQAHRRWIENRWLAERLRAAIFLAACGLEAATNDIQPTERRKRRRGGWMEAAFNEIWDRLPPMTGCADASCAPAAGFIREVWIKAQMDFHELKAEKSERLSRRLETAGFMIFGIALAAPALHLLLFKPVELLHGVIGEETKHALEDALVFSALALPAIGAAIGGIRMHREYSRLAKRSEDMLSALTNLYDTYDRARTPETLEAIVRQTELLMLSEVEDWLTLTKFSVLEYVA